MRLPNSTRPTRTITPAGCLIRHRPTQRHDQNDINPTFALGPHHAYCGSMTKHVIAALVLYMGLILSPSAAHAQDEDFRSAIDNACFDGYRSGSGSVFIATGSTLFITMAAISLPEMIESGECCSSGALSVSVVWGLVGVGKVMIGSLLTDLGVTAQPYDESSFEYQAWEAGLKLGAGNTLIGMGTTSLVFGLSTLLIVAFDDNPRDGWWVLPLILTLAGGSVLGAGVAIRLEGQEELDAVLANDPFAFGGGQPVVMPLWNARW